MIQIMQQRWMKKVNLNLIKKRFLNNNNKEYDNEKDYTPFCNDARCEYGECS